MPRIEINIDNGNTITGYLIEDSNYHQIPQERLISLLETVRTSPVVTNKNITKNQTTLIIDNLERLQSYHEARLANEQFASIVKETKYKPNHLQVKRHNPIKKLSLIAGALVTSVTISAASWLAVAQIKNSHQEDIESDHSSSVTYDIPKHPEVIIDSPNPSQTTTNVAPISNPIVEEDIPCFEFDYENRFNNEAATTTKGLYQELINHYAQIYGNDPQLMTAIATQENCTHDECISTSGIGLFQIEGSAWNNETVTAYNHDTQSYETVKVDINSLGDLEYNIKIANMIFSKQLQNQNYNVILALQTYNMGLGNIDKVLSACSHQEGIPTSVLREKDHYEWINYLNYAIGGDPEYLSHVLSYINPDQNTLEFQTPDNQTIKIQINNTHRVKLK